MTYQVRCSRSASRSTTPDGSEASWRVVEQTYATRTCLAGVNGQFNIPTGGQVKVPTPRGQLRSAATSFDQVRDSNRLVAMGA